MLVLLLLLVFLSSYFSLGYCGYADVISLPLSLPLFPLFSLFFCLQSGGVAYVGSSSSAIFTSCTLTKNTATSSGGVVDVQGTGSSATFNSCTLTENTAKVSYPVLYYYFYF